MFFYVALLILLADTGAAVGELVAVVTEFVASVVMGCPRFTSKAQITVTAHTTDPPIRAATVNMHAFDLFSKKFMLLAPHNGESALFSLVVRSIVQTLTNTKLQ